MACKESCVRGTADWAPTRYGQYGEDVAFSTNLTLGLLQPALHADYAENPVRNLWFANKETYQGTHFGVLSYFSSPFLH